MAALYFEGRLTLRALRAWGALPPRFDRLALELRDQGVDLMGADPEQVLAWFWQAHTGESDALSRRLDDLEDLTAFVDALVARLVEADADVPVDPELAALWKAAVVHEPVFPEYPEPVPERVHLGQEATELLTDPCRGLELAEEDREADSHQWPEHPHDLLQTPLAQQVQGLSQVQLDATVSVTREVMRQFMPPMDPSQAMAYEESWAQVMDFPSMALLHWLDRMNPLLVEALAHARALDVLFEMFEEALFEAEMAAAYDADETVESHMRVVGAIHQRVQSHGQRLTTLGDHMEALGPPPDPRMDACDAQQRFARRLNDLMPSHELEGAYMQAPISIRLEESEEHPDGWTRHRRAERHAIHQVYERLSTEPDGVVMFYRFEERERDRYASHDEDVMPELQGVIDQVGERIRADMGRDRDWWEVIHADPLPDGWVTYDYDEDRGQRLGVTFYRPTPERLFVDHYRVVGDEVTSARRTVHQRQPEGLVVRRYVTGESRASIQQAIQENREELREALAQHRRSRQAYQDFLRAGGELPPLPDPEELHWVLVDVSHDQDMERRELTGQPWGYPEMNPNLERHCVPVDLEYSLGRMSLDWQVETTRRETHYQAPTVSVPACVQDGSCVQVYNPRAGEPGSGPRVETETVTVEEESRRTGMNWAFPPAVMADGSEWRPRVGGEGEWRWRVYRTPSGQRHTSLSAAMTQAMAAPRLPGMEYVAGTGPAGQTPVIPFHSGEIRQSQHDHVMAVIAHTDCGNVQARFHYRLTELSADEARHLARRIESRLLSDAPLEGDLLMADHADAADAPPEEVPEVDPIAARIAHHENNIDLLRDDLGHYRSMLSQATDAKARKNLSWMILAKQADLQGEIDAIATLQTGQFTRTRTGWDDMLQLQAENNTRALAKKIAQETRVVDSYERAFELMPEQDRMDARAWAEATLGTDYDLDQLREVTHGLLERAQQGQLAEFDRHQADAEWYEWYEDRLETVKTASEYTMLAAPFITGGGTVALAYSLSSGSVDGYQTGGVLGEDYRGATGMIAGLGTTMVRQYSSRANHVITFYEGYQTGGITGGASHWARSYVRQQAIGYATNVGLHYQNKYIRGREQARLGAWREAQREVDFRQQRQYGKAMVQSHHDLYQEHRHLKRSGAPASQVRAMERRLMDSTAAIKHAPHAKGYLKFGDPDMTPAQRAQHRQMQREYNATDRLHTRRVVRDYRNELARAGYDTEQLSFRPIRNAGNTSPGMDLDLAVTVRDGQHIRYRDPVTGQTQALGLYEANGRLNKIFEGVYGRHAGGRSASESFQMVTTNAHLEAYRTEGGHTSPWIRFPEIIGRGDVLGAQGSALQAIDPRHAADAARITEFKAQHMASHYAHMGRDNVTWEVYRGTAKDINTKVRPLLRERLRNTPDPEHRAKLRADYDFFTQLAQSMELANHNPVEADRQVRRLTGYHGLDVVDRIGLTITALGQFR
ncbi:hypothetical protein [Ectothiorhodospira variabilis]|nr:hypothetical protein [Ectothiorhodospira variabilis]MCG5495509.1 hypothetical protein [Ectothiorhodospira variabilis]MCG5499131.1 hypothetical protein [Ectothiorhodospira variabilis]